LENQASISKGFPDIQWRDAMVDVTLIRPLNKCQGHSFWYQSISHNTTSYRLNSSVNSNFCSRTHRPFSHNT